MNRSILIAIAALLTTLALSACAESPDPKKESVSLTTYKSATCGCCKIWVEHAQQSGFNVVAKDVEDLNGVKKQHHISPRYQSCHTTVSEQGYVFEGHVPAKLIQRFLQNPPQNAIGLAVPGMPLGSPGMEVGDRFTPYQVMLLNKNGSSEIYAEINTAQEQF
ncbi:DUF411 domain-containing protein [Microbulbifer sp. JMSA004]|uniref:DUF411 domain-containing protein n=1 Tax=unclassified Microbulbifer TaxID=2619833 RepID=UPI0024ACCBAE|nr:DUF411 domain-containing protein [Microbulbifer sp. VAAF005]WHI45474.1 DUF411 domain-containing protein [Microbulbifer sp. VAAF005]